MPLPPEKPKGVIRRAESDYRRKFHKELALARAVKVDLVEGITTFKKKVDLSEVVKAVRTRQYDRISRLIPWHELEPDLMGAINHLLAAGEDGVKRGIGDVSKVADYPELHRFDLKNPKFHDFVSRRTGNLITVVQDGTVPAVRAAVSKAFTHGWTPRDVADAIKGSIGLNARQAQALVNYRTSLSTPQKDGSTLAPERVSRLSAQYEARLLDQRAVMIGRTEVRQAASAGQKEVWEQAHLDGIIEHDTQRMWQVDGNPCPEICEPMDGETIGLYDVWTLPDGSTVETASEAHPQCYCYESLVV